MNEQHECHWHWETRGRSCCQCDRFVPGHESDSITECKHLKSITVPERQGFKETIKFTYCPKCGEKL